MTLRISPVYWPILALVAPVVAPGLLLRNGQYRRNIARADELNRRRLERGEPLDLPELEFLELTALVEWEAEDGFQGDPGVSYLLRSDRGSLLFDIGFGRQNDTLARNAAKLGVDIGRVDAVAISHLHPDHAGGMGARRSGRLGWPEELGDPEGKPCFLPDKAAAEGFRAVIVEGPQMLTGGIASAGPLARSLFFMGLTEEQALVANVAGKGLVVLTGCGHMGIELALRMVGLISDKPLHALCGGLHLPLTRGRGLIPGVEVQCIVGTGKPPWRRINDEDVSSTIAAINAAGPEKLYLSAHDTCDAALARIQAETDTEALVIKAGATYRF